MTSTGPLIMRSQSLRGSVTESVGGDKQQQSVDGNRGELRAWEESRSALDQIGMLFDSITL